MQKEFMSPRSRILSAIYGGRVDRVPVGCITSVVTHEQMDKIGVSFPEAHVDPEAMAKLAAASYEILGWDTIKVPFSVWNLSAALGAPMDWGNRNKWPDGLRPIYHGPDHINVPSDLLDQESTKAVIEAIKILRKKYPHVAIVGTVMGTITQSFNLIGVEKVMKMIATEPDQVKKICHILKEPVIDYANAQIEAGIDVLDFADHATGGLVSAKTYKDLVMPVHKEILSRVKCPVVLHICGNTYDRLEHIIEAGFPCFNIDMAVDPFKAKLQVKDKLSLWGGVPNINSVLQGTPEMVKQEAKKSLAAGYEILGNECSVPLQAKDINLIAFLEAAQEFAVPLTDEEKLAQFGRGLARMDYKSGQKNFENLLRNVSNFDSKGEVE
ncbi:MtaA/CmuA family methyltransferase [Candidatus Formimonas warabiya]|uniref:Uroporphyrinogen decarboxylase (URO-D) domain-containing protein n=1 Tax=Formimonas warabiya TaxID=1761012 RepID=A0A3G1L080_FORW1|nr:MtaA/CmuA family methyltransferase [Candidatus Formimonas warabiya]ATW28051.1 hypothetical protein DCMF_27815 [Candidatus Formimonas warabiya]